LKDPWVIGCCLYQLGGAENFVDLLPKLGDYILTNPSTPVDLTIDPPIDPPAPTKQRGAPHTQYARKFVLLGRE
jgi:hypothetical protein